MSLRTVFKYPLPPLHGMGPAYAVERRMLAQGRVVHALFHRTGVDDEYRLTLWAEFPVPDAPPEEALSVNRRFMVVGDGEPIEDGWTYVATTPNPHGVLVHVYELAQVEAAAAIKVRTPEYGRRADPR